MSTFNYNYFYTNFAKILNKTGDLSSFVRQIPLVVYTFPNHSEKILTFQIYQFPQHCIGYRNNTAVRLESTLGYDHTGQLA